MKKFFKSLLALLLVVIIVGGLGYIGYSYYFMDPFKIAAHGQTNTSDQTTDQSMQGMSNMQGMDMSNMNGQMQNSDTTAMDAVTMAMGNKESLDTAMATLNEAIAYMTLDPYAPAESSNQTGNSNSMNNMQMPETTPDTGATNPDGTAATNTVEGNTTINIYPQTNAQQSSSTTTMAMTDMGTVYDAGKMEQLHSGLYKLSVGMQLLDQLNKDFELQAEFASAGVDNPVQYYTNQYTLLLQNKSKLNKALININEAANLVNINPYVSEKGLVYDKARMQKIHESIFKMAQGVAALNKLDSEMTNQAVTTANMAQTYANNANMNASMGNMNQTMNNGIFGGLFSNISMPNIVNMILIVFVTMFILGLFGFIFSLLKTPAKSSNNGVK